MTKREVVWLMVRVVGVCLLLNACRYLFIVIENILNAVQADKGAVVLSQGSGLIAGWVLEAIVSFIAGMYLIKDGGLLFRWLNHEPDTRA